MRIVRAADCRVMPWKNGGGSTTQIAVQPEGASLDAFDWRISMAHVGQDGPFSSFAGLDRTLSVLAGEGITLAFADGEAARLDRASDPFGFAADRAVEGRLVAGAIDDLNVMTRRGQWRHKVRRITTSQPLTADDGLLVLVSPLGRWRLSVDGRSDILDPGDSAILDAPADIEASCEADGDLFAIALHRA